MELDEYALMAEVEDQHWWWRARREIITRTLEEYAPNAQPGGRRVLEVGCGTGGNLPALARFGRVLGAEHEPAALEFLTAKNADRFEVIQHTIPAPIPGTFDILAMLDVLEHIEGDAAALRWVADQLRPGGVAVLTVPAFPFLWSEHDVAARHFRRYTLQSLTSLVPPELEIVHQTYFNALLFPAVAAVRLGMRLLPRRWRPRGTQMALPPAPFNWLAYQLFRLERHLVPRRRAALGVSALLVLRRRPS
jgi:SAM-dependent methyltransferase